MRMTRYPTTTRANLRRSPSSSPETPYGHPRPRTDTTNSSGYHDDQNSFRDILDDEPVLPVGNLNICNESDEDSHAEHDTQNTSDNASTTTIFAGQGDNDREEGTGNYSSDSSGSPTKNAARYGRSPRRGLVRPRSYRLRDEAYIAMTDLRDKWAPNTNHVCQECKDGSRCWCPIKRESPNTNGRRSRSRHLVRCRSCQQRRRMIL